ncbi:MAG: hypothetical protein HYS43_01840 [Candidatus Liptonbacteria bacterium]|nr:hypothetical protein [Candidatus Liptonbacteria bacterium]
MARLKFEAVFVEHVDGTLEPRQRVRVGGVTLSPGVNLGRGVNIGGIDFTQFKGHDLEAQIDGDTLVITAIY